MNANTSKRLRDLLLKHPEGLDIGTISNALEREYTNVAKRLHATYGCYVKSWNGQRQVWACVPEPVNAPRPAYVRKPYVPFKPAKLIEKAATRVNRAEPLTQDVLGEVPYTPQKTVWQQVKPWPRSTNV
ncbi:hypothetical protein [Polynucleobacter sp. UK-Kesae-W10]|uniref:hypothetical protein n=1 Tax=Polynucleobacter sp. UK-Kesae-W10 TaxID=1819738 RepID=UPI001C0BF527|nr:hypothetical protein [Polynucleobacter sp. UK-Kesae-W10]MBU3577553.1 hypothetical protein [Polynucleobacter sp. UK-Kesae-W10]